MENVSHFYANNLLEKKKINQTSILSWPHVADHKYWLNPVLTQFVWSEAQPVCNMSFCINAACLAYVLCLLYSEDNTWFSCVIVLRVRVTNETTRMTEQVSLSCPTGKHNMTVLVFYANVNHMRKLLCFYVKPKTFFKEGGSWLLWLTWQCSNLFPIPPISALQRMHNCAQIWIFWISLYA